MEASDVDICIFEGGTVEKEIETLARFRVRYFKEFPYLYVGTEEDERRHMQEYVSNPSVNFCVARNGNTVIGVGIGTALSAETGILEQIGGKMENSGLDINRFYYFGELILLPEYRNRGLGNRMLDRLRDAGRKQKRDRFCFLAVHREPDDLRRPAGYYDNDEVFRKFGFQKTSFYVTFSWPTIQADGSVMTVANRLYFWIDEKKVISSR